MPGETKADLEDARRNLREIASNWFNIACASPIVGSEIHEISKAKAISRSTIWDPITGPPSSIPRISAPSSSRNTSTS